MSRDVVALVLVASVAAAAILGISPDGAAARPGLVNPVGRTALRVTSNSLACPLTPDQEKKAVDAFHEMMPVLSNPRCLNCHGGVDIFLAADDGRHLGGAMDRPENPKQCQECHSGLPGWQLPVSGMFWVGLSEKDLCILFKKTSAGPTYFVGHIRNENGGPVQFTATAFKGDRALNKFGRDISEEMTKQRFRPVPPPMTHPQFLARAQTWANAIGAGWKSQPECGCEITPNAWEGTVTTEWSQRTATFGLQTESATATARFVIDPDLTSVGDPAQYWKSVSGTIKWSASATGGVCTLSVSGTTPIGRGGDGNPMGGLRIEPDSSGTGVFTISNAPWPEAYDPELTYKCREGPPLQGRLNALSFWWQTAPAGAPVSADGKTITGAYSKAIGEGTIQWRWDFRRVP